MSLHGRPNIIFAFGEDWGRFASTYGRQSAPCRLSEVISTPNFDRIASEGALFLNARAPAPGCNPCRSSVMSGRYFWQTGLGAIEQGTEWDASIATFPLELEKSGYFLGYTYEGDFGKTNRRIGDDRTAFNFAGHNFGDFSRWVSKSTLPVKAAKQELGTEVRRNFCSFLDAAAKSLPDQPFCYCWGPTTTHRGGGWQPGSGKALWGIDPDQLSGRLPAFLPDVPEVRQDMSDYLGECCAMDYGLGILIAELEARGQLDRTLIVVSGDHGPPGFPRGKANVYDFGAQVALAVRWPGTVSPGRVVHDFVNTMDLAPTLCEIGGVTLPSGMTAKSLLPILQSPKSGQIEDSRDFAICGLERHVSISREGFLPFPVRSLRTSNFLYILNFEPDRWPMGDPYGLDDLSVKVDDVERISRDTMLIFPDCDASPTKAWIIRHRNDAAATLFFQIAFGKRPREELYDLSKDADCMRNVASDPLYAGHRQRLESRLMSLLQGQQDPRATEKPCRYDQAPFAELIDKYKTDKGKAMMKELQQARAAWVPEKRSKL
eukprot:TRINITY_DN110570_c0_g1_i1.p1 TRINITY_DN110570_c0_g1~~TRINITY_DN110570_c0_g1_i1.p1  ORF type:complete len:546 (-),score=78.24 TRINITY_DN110570_c0_g1_i1:99-1736(-)